MKKFNHKEILCVINIQKIAIMQVRDEARDVDRDVENEVNVYFRLTEVFSLLLFLSFSYYESKFDIFYVVDINNFVFFWFNI